MSFCFFLSSRSSTLRHVTEKRRRTMALWKIAEHRKPAIRTLFLLSPAPLSLSLLFPLSLFLSRRNDTERSSLCHGRLSCRVHSISCSRTRGFFDSACELNRQMRPDAIASPHLVSSHLLSHLVERVLLSLCVTAAFIGATSWIRCNYRSSCYYSEPRKVHYDGYYNRGNLSSAIPEREKERCTSLRLLYRTN